MANLLFTLLNSTSYVQHINGAFVCHAKITAGLYQYVIKLMYR